MRKYSIFLVDVDDTLLDFHRASLDGLKAVFESFNIAWQPRFGEVFTRLNNRLWESLERKEITRQYLHDVRFSMYLESLGIEGVSGNTYNERFLQYLARNPVYKEGAEAFLTALNKLGRVYFVTNGTLWIQQSRFEIAGLYRYGLEAFVSDAIGYDKPSPKYTEYVLSHIPDFEREKAVWIGDSLSADICAANEAKIDSVWFNYREKTASGKIQPTYEAKNFEEILQILTGNEKVGNFFP